MRGAPYKEGDTVIYDGVAMQVDECFMRGFGVGAGWRVLIRHSRSGIVLEVPASSVKPFHSVLYDVNSNSNVVPLPVRHQPAPFHGGDAE